MRRTDGLDDVPIDAVIVASRSEHFQRTERLVWRGEGEPGRRLTVGMLVLELPDATTQRTGFVVPWFTARVVLANFTGYKIAKRLGE